MTSAAADNRLSRIGVVGGGQLVRMRVDAARQRNVEVIVQTPSLADPAAQIAADVIEADPVDADATQALLKRCSSITFENEWVSIEALTALERKGARFRPSLASLIPLVN